MSRSEVDTCSVSQPPLPYCLYARGVSKCLPSKDTGSAAECQPRPALTHAAAVHQPTVESGGKMPGTIGHNLHLKGGNAELIICRQKKIWSEMRNINDGPHAHSHNKVPVTF